MPLVTDRVVLWFIASYMPTNEEAVLISQTEGQIRIRNASESTVYDNNGAPILEVADAVAGKIPAVYSHLPDVTPPAGQSVVWEAPKDGKQYARQDGNWTEVSGGGGSGGNGWTPVLAVATDGARRVLEVTDWTGGAGAKPAVGVYVGSAGFVTAIGDAVDIRGAAGAAGEKGDKGDKGDAGDNGQGVPTGGTTGQILAKTSAANFATEWIDPAGGGGGDNGWSPILAIVNDGARRVLQVTDWTGGSGTKPAAGGFIGATGIVATAALAVDIRGAAGAKGDKGDTGDNGSAGAAGSQILRAAGAPDSGTGANGDYYINNTNGAFYGPKAAGSWPATWGTVVTKPLRSDATGITGGAEVVNAVTMTEAAYAALGTKNANTLYFTTAS